MLLGDHDTQGARHTVARAKPGRLHPGCHATAISQSMPASIGEAAPEVPSEENAVPTEEGGASAETSLGGQHCHKRF